MRIISGYLGGRVIKVPDSKLIRPTTDRVRETLFNILNNKIDFDGIKVLDLYAGSGSLGFEALSRGAAEIHFVEKNFVIYNNLMNNIKSLSVENNCKIFKMDVVRYTSSAFYKYDLILADPPFFKDEIHIAAKNILQNELFSKPVLSKTKETVNYLFFYIGIEGFLWGKICSSIFYNH